MATWLKYVKLSDPYERKARLLPAFFSLLTLVPVGVMLGAPLGSGWKLLGGGLGLGAVICVGLSHLASAFGNHLQGRLWPRWPHDAPTNEALHPTRSPLSVQRREQLYDAMLVVVGIDLRRTFASGTEGEIEAAINDVVTQVRGLLHRSPRGKRLQRFNIDYGYARNLTGMRPMWLGFTTLGTAACWMAFYFGKEQGVSWPIISSVVTVACWPTAFAVLPQYVRAKARYYTEAFYQGLDALREAKQTAQPSRE